MTAEGRDFVITGVIKVVFGWFTADSKGDEHLGVIKGVESFSPFLLSNPVWIGFDRPYRLRREGGGGICDCAWAGVDGLETIPSPLVFVGI